MKQTLVLAFLLAVATSWLAAQKLTVPSPNQTMAVWFFPNGPSDAGGWSLQATYNTNVKTPADKRFF